MTKVLLLNCYTKIALAASEYLDPSYELYGAAPEPSFGWLRSLDKLFLGRRYRKVFRYAPKTSNLDNFASDIIGMCKAASIDLVLPIGSASSLALSCVKDRIKQETQAVPVIDDASRVTELGDKWKMACLCMRVGVPIPRTILIDSRDSALSQLRTFKFPVVIKPRLSTGSKGVTFCNSMEEAAACVEECLGDTELSEIPVDGPSYIAQEVVRGKLHDVAVCADKGRVVSSLSQHRYQTLYDFGGGGIINETTDEPLLRSYGEKAVGAIGYSGVAIFDFIKTADGQYFCLECNPRFWGTLHLTLSSGLNVVQQMVDILGHGKNPPAVPTYEKGLVFKWYFPDCVAHWVTKPRTLGAFFRRVRHTFRSIGNRTLTNFKPKNFRYLIGIVLNKA